MTLRARVESLERRCKLSDRPAHVVVIVCDPDGRRWLARTVPRIILPETDRRRFVPVPESIPTPPGHRLIIREVAARVPLEDVRIAHRPGQLGPLVFRRIGPGRWEQDPPGEPFISIPDHDGRFESDPSDEAGSDFHHRL